MIDVNGILRGITLYIKVIRYFLEMFTFWVFRFFVGYAIMLRMVLYTMDKCHHFGPKAAAVMEGYQYG